ncbi:hypothetical protein NE237_016831 [Protea cynaroides]|uniref:Uncharacterized protein n=1 Tax=Protea cynaroides TaxID=273540 RepID=A0A9Q0K6M6_9MAGN|nr:hypothetical protein NE237_016831 [Protea cynaroides]
MQVGHPAAGGGGYQPLDKSTEGIFSVDSILVWRVESVLSWVLLFFLLDHTVVVQKSTRMLLCKWCNFCVHEKRGIHAKTPISRSGIGTQGILNLPLKSYIQIIYRL